jgi:DNA polymerase III delta subunit
VKKVKTGYLFHGEELFLARVRLEELKRGQAGSEGEPPPEEERFDLEETSWRDILDHARNMPFFFSPWRFLVVKADKAELADLEDDEASVLKEFFASPTPQTVIVVFFQGKLARTKALFKLFDSLPESVVEIEEMKPLKGATLVQWVEKKAEALGKRANSAAVERLIEVVGDDLRLVDAELLKLAAYVGEKKTIELADVLAVTDWGKSFDPWDLTRALETGDTGRAILVLDKTVADGTPVQVLIGTLASFLRDILIGRIGLAGGKDKREIFAEVHPKINPSWQPTYDTKFRNYFHMVEKLGSEDLVRLLAALEEIDLRIKTSEADGKILLEVFCHDFGRTIGRTGVTSRGRG